MAWAVFLPSSGQAASVILSPSGGNDSAAFNAAAANCNNGGLITLNAGTYNVSNLTMPSNCTIAGVGNPVLKAALPGYPLFNYAYASNTIIQNITIDGGGIYGSKLVNFTFSGNTIQNIPYRGLGVSDGFHISTMDSSTIQGNHFLNIGTNCFPAPPQGGPDECNAAFGVYYPTNTVITNNTFDTVEEGIKFYESFPPNTTVINDQITSNAFVHVHRMAIEIQYSGDGVVVSGNSFSQWINPFWGSMCISYAAYGKSQITNNICDGSFSAGGAGYFGICIENMSGADISGNVCEFDSSTPVTWTWGAHVASYPWNTPGTIIRNNTFCGSGGGLTGLPSAGTSVGSNNTISPTCGSLYVQPSTSYNLNNHSSQMLFAQLRH